MQPPTARRKGAAAIVLCVLAVVLGLTHPSALAAQPPAPHPAVPVFDVRAYGAKGDGSANDTPAIDKAITAAGSAGGGTVRFPAGAYKSKNTIHMKSHVTLQVDKGATIQGSSADTYDKAEPNPNDAYQDYGHSHFHDAMIYGDRLTDIGFVGQGVIDGMGNLITGNPGSGEADKIISLTRCDGLRIGDGLTLRRGGHFAALINGCKNVTSDHLNIDTASDRDGWNVISTTDVTITDANIKANDDALVFKSDYALGAKLANGHVRVSSSYLSAKCCNALMFGSETCGDFSDYQFEKIRIEGADKSGLGMVSMDGAKISDVHYRDITMTGVHSPIMQKIGTRKRCGNSPGIGSISDVTYDNITATGNSPSFSPTLWGETGHRINGVTFNNVHITVPGGNGTMSTAVPSNDPNDYNPKAIGTRPAYGWYLHNADNVQFTDSSVRFAANDGRPAVLANAASGIRFTRFTAQRGSDSPFDAGFQNVTGYCLADSHNSSGGALRVSGSGSTENCTAAPAAFAPASDNGQSVRPAMGWSSWSFVRRQPTEAKIKAQADALASTGLKDHGFVYINLDDFWQKCDSNGFVVDSYGRWAVDPAKFPSGIKALADYIHAKGLKFGFYVTPGIAKNAVTKNTPIEGTSYHAKDIADTSKTEKNYNCKNMYYIDYGKPGAQEFVNSWARQFASWGVDYLKIDGVGSQDIPDVQAWDKALRATGRPINFALSNNLSLADAPTWRKLANSWRTQGDVECYCGPGSNGSGYPLTDWSHVFARFNTAASWQPYAGPGGWNDLDSLELGNGDQVGLTADQRRSHFTLWAMAASPLLLGTDLTHLDSVDKAMLTNDRLIGVDQDGVAAKRVVNSGVKQVWSKRENSGAYVVALFNTGTSGSSTVTVNWSQVGFAGSGDVTDLWSGSHKGVIADSYSATLRPGETRLIRVNPVNGQLRGQS
ncbi:glycosyl hydrolase family 28 protein [Streptomyces sp. NBC_01613]|uniref:glycosyl hydrolase family 28 protein n=1 Tax=Streptomyces sp. NBC_01613 TaxID=2975896 RepID=UPI00386FACDE